MSAIEDIINERIRQDQKWGQQDHPDLHPFFGPNTGKWVSFLLDVPTANEARNMCEAGFSRGRGDWAHVLLEEVAEAFDAIGQEDTEHLREELVQVAAVAVAWVEALDRRKNLQKD